MKIRIVIADDHRILREGLASLLAIRGLDVVGQACNGEEVILMVRELKPHVVLMDLEMPQLDGVAATRMIKQQFPSIKVLILSAFDENERVFETMKAGASGYVLKRASADDLIQIIKACHAGEVFVSPYLANLALSEARGAQTIEKQNGSRSYGLLTSHEQKILELITKGLSNKELAHSMNLSPDTIKVHLKHIFEKLHVDNRTQAAVVAVEQRLIHSS